MPICHNKKLIFIHIPKTGGSSIEKSLDIQHIESLYSHKTCGESIPDILRLFQGNEQQKVHTVTPQHLTAKQLKTILKTTFDEYHKFAVVRNPYDRMVSEYCYIQTNDHARFKPYRHINFKTFIQKVLNLPEMIRHSLFDSHLNTQYSFIFDSDNFLADRVFKFETLTDVFTTYNLKLEHERKSKRVEWSYYLDDVSKQLINDVYDIDFTTFKYTKY